MAKYLIIGATGGVGRTLIEILAKGGHSFHLIARNHHHLEQLSHQYSASFATADVNDLNSLKQAIEACTIENGIAGLCYCVGSINLKSIQTASAEDYLNAFQLNVLGAAMTIKYALPGLKKSASSVVLFSSVAAQRGFLNHSVISAAKAAIEGLTVALAAELSPIVRVNCIAPSLTKTPLSEALLKDTKIADLLAQKHPLKRLGMPQDLAEMAAFLLTDKSAWITGQIMAIDGGRSTIDK